jgi:hypothetical protein
MGRIKRGANDKAEVLEPCDPVTLTACERVIPSIDSLFATT